MKRTLAVGGVVAIAAAALGSWLTQGAPAKTTALVPYQDEDAVALGRRIYAEHCAACHGDRLQGEVPNWREAKPNGRLPAPPHDETGHTWHHDDRVLFLITKYGSERLVGGGYESDMAGFDGTLSDDEILAVLGFIKSTWPKEVADAHNQRNRAAAGE